jgi:hypothetical protein
MGTWTYTGASAPLGRLTAVSEISIALGHPAITPEVRAWLNHRPGATRPVLTRGSGRGSVLRVEVDGDSEAEVQDEVESLMTDLRMLGLRPTLLTTDAV